MKMACVNIAIVLLLGSCFASTSGLYIERSCDWDTLMDCTKSMNEMMGEDDTDIMCPPMQEAKTCLEATQGSCDEENTGILNAIKGYMDSLMPYIEKCPNQDFGIAKTLFESNSDTTEDHSDHNNYNTSPEPWGEPSNTNHETSSEPWGEPHNECTAEMYTKCVNIMQDNSGAENDMNKMCSTYEEAKSCFEGFYHHCDEGYVKQAVESYMPSILNTLRAYCGHDNHGTSPEPWGEPSNNYETSPEPWGEPHYECSWDGYKKCSEIVDSTNGESDMQKICSLYDEAKGCFKGFINECGQFDSEIMQSVQSSMGSIENTMRMYCHHENHETSPEPWGEPNGNECTWERFEICGNSLKSMETMADPSEICRVWWKNKACLGSLIHMCEHSDKVLVATVNATWREVEPHVRYCDGYIRCTMDARRRCVDKVKQAWSVEDKCRNVEPARQCLQELTDDCPDEYEMHQIRSVAMPWADQMRNDCMYGNMKGGGSMTGDNEAWSRASSSESVHMTKTVTSLLAVSVAMVVKVSAYRL